MLSRDRASYPRRHFRASRRAWVRANWFRLTLALLLFLVAALAQRLWAQGYLLGLLQAGILGVFTVAVTATFFAHTNTAGQMAGAWGEDLTRDELRKARRRRLIWDSVDGVETENGDVDHLVVTRHAGVIAIDSKWRNDPDRDTVMRDAASAAAAARRAGLVLRSFHHPMDVAPVVAVWGAGRSSVPRSVEVDGVEFINGGQLVPWLRGLPRSPVDKRTGRLLLTELRAFKRRVQPG